MSASEPSGRELRIGDREREAAVDALGEHYAAGRLTREEYDERADAAWQARTGSALAPLFADLPSPAVPSPVPAGPPTAQAPEQRPTAAQASRRVGVRMVPLLVLAIVLSALVHAPVFLLLVVWLLWSRSTRGPWAHPGHRTGPGGRVR
jgi:DUF1707 SHOCT-like domain